MPKVKFTQKDRRRYSAITTQLANMSHNGWSNATHVDYEPLEAELAALGQKMIDSQTQPEPDKINAEDTP